MPVRMNNPLNIKVGGATKKWIEDGLAQVGERAQDGGRFLHFTSPEVGLRAAQDLLTGPVYNDLSQGEALKKWSNNGYGADIVQGVDPQTTVSQLTPAELAQTLAAMRQRESGGSGEGAQAPVPFDDIDQAARMPL